MSLSSPTDSQVRTGTVLALAAATGFAAKAVFVKLAYRHGVDAVTLLTLRLIGVLAILALARLWRRPVAEPVSRRDCGWLLMLGLFGYYLASIFDFIGLQTVSASIERLVLYLYPTLTVLLSAWLFSHVITRRMIGALLLTYMGIALVIGADLLHARADPVGLAWIVASTVAYACYLSFSPPVIARVGALRFTELALTISAAAMLVHFALTRPLTALIQPWPVYLWAGVMALVSTVLPVYLMNVAVQRLGAGRSAVVGSIGPVLTIVMSMGVLGEHLSALQWLGAAVVMAGVALVGRSK
ncbi:MAG TPA: DMT family transporter [Chitinolyticbacter sp.]|nr:DMT family transporter [Chitinolyticbacter sp.]